MIGEPENDIFGDFIKSNMHYMKADEMAKHKPVLFTRVKRRAQELASDFYKIPELAPDELPSERIATETTERRSDSAFMKKHVLRSNSTMGPSTPVHGQNRGFGRGRDRLASFGIDNRHLNKSMPLKKVMEQSSEDDSVEAIFKKKRITIPDRAYLVRKLNMSYKEILELRSSNQNEGAMKVVDTGITPIKGKYLNLASQEYWENSTRKHLKFKNYIEKVNKKFKFDKQPPKSQLDKFFMNLNKQKDPINEYIEANFEPDFRIKDRSRPLKSHYRTNHRKSRPTIRLPSIESSRESLSMPSKIRNVNEQSSDLTDMISMTYGSPIVNVMMMMM